MGIINSWFGTYPAGVDLRLSDFMGVWVFWAAYQVAGGFWLLNAKLPKKPDVPPNGEKPIW